MKAIELVLDESLELLDALGVHLEDDRWAECAQKMRLAVEELRRPSDLYERVLRIEQRERELATSNALEQHIAELSRATVNADAMKKDRDRRKKEREELEQTRARLLARRARLDREVERLPARGTIRIPPRKPVLFVRAIAAKLLKR